jgi:uncharacterized protein YkwD
MLSSRTALFALLFAACILAAAAMSVEVDEEASPRHGGSVPSGGKKVSAAFKAPFHGRQAPPPKAAPKAPKAPKQQPKTHMISAHSITIEEHEAHVGDLADAQDDDEEPQTTPVSEVRSMLAVKSGMMSESQLEATATCGAAADVKSILTGLNHLRRTAKTYPHGTRRGANLKLSSSLSRAAKAHLKRLIHDKTLKHYPDLAALPKRGWTKLGENIAYAFDGVKSMPKEWYSEVHNLFPPGSPEHYGHRQNLMDPKFKYIGIAVGTGPAPFGNSGTATYAVTIFADKDTGVGPKVKSIHC